MEFALEFALVFAVRLLVDVVAVYLAVLGLSVSVLRVGWGGVRPRFAEAPCLVAGGGAILLLLYHAWVLFSGIGGGSKFERAAYFDRVLGEYAWQYLASWLGAYSLCLLVVPYVRNRCWFVTILSVMAAAAALYSRQGLG